MPYLRQALVLDEMLVFREEEDASGSRLEAGVGAMLGIFRALRKRAASLGFTELTFTYHRTGDARPGRIIARTRSLD